MRRRSVWWLVAGLGIGLAQGCGGDPSPTTPVGGGAGGAAGQGGSSAGGSAPIDKAAPCASTFGDELTDSFGRLDGTILAVVGPTDTQCPQPNSDHLVLQVRMGGEAYRMVVNVQSDYGDPDVRMLAVEQPLGGPAWSEGWHTDVSLDYPTDLEAHIAAFTPYPMDELVERVTAELELGASVSVFAVSSGGTYAASAHLIHRNNNDPDGAIVIDPTTHPRYLLFAFADQDF